MPMMPADLNARLVAAGVRVHGLEPVRRTLEQVVLEATARMIRVELVKLLRRPRTWVTIAALNALPTLVAVLLAVTDLGPRPGTGPPFLSAVLTDGTLFPLAALGIVLPLFLPVAVAVVGGDAVAGEVQTDTLRYLLVRPVSRLRVLLAKLVSVVVVRARRDARRGRDRVRRGQALPRRCAGDRRGERLRHHPDRGPDGAAHPARVHLRRARDARGRGDRAVPEHADRLSGGRRTRHHRVPDRLHRAAGARRCGVTAALPAHALLAGVRGPVPRSDPVDGLVHGVLAQLGYLVVFAGAAWANFATKDVNK